MDSFIIFLENNIEYIEVFNHYAPYIAAVSFVLSFLYQFKRK